MSVHSYRPALVASFLTLAFPSLVFAQPAPAAAPPPAAAPVAPGAAQPTATPPSPELPASKIEAELKARLSAPSGHGLTSDQAAQRAVNTSTTLELKQRSLEAADAGVSQAQAGYWPQLTVSARYTRLNDIGDQSLGFGGGGLVVTATPTTAPRPVGPGEQLLAVPADFSFPVVLNQYSIGASLSIPLSDYVLRTSKAVNAAQQNKSAAEFDQKATKASVARDARVQYYEWVRVLAQEVIAEQGLEQTKGHYSDAKNSFQAGLSSRADVLRAEAAVKNAELFQERVKNIAVLTLLRLRILMGDTGNAAYEVGEDVLSDPRGLENAPTPAAAYEEALRNRAELRVLDSYEAALYEQAKVARAGNYPRLDAQGNVGYANPNQRYFPQQEEWHSSWDVSLVLSWTPTDIPGARAQSSVAEARAAEVAAQRRALRDSLKMEVNQALQGVSEARFALTVSLNGLRASEESYRVRRELYRAGRATSVEVTDSETELTLARMVAVNARIDARIALVALAHAIGRDVAPG